VIGAKFVRALSAEESNANPRLQQSSERGTAPQRSLPGLTGQSIILRKVSGEEGWTRGSSPRVTDVGTGP